MTLCRFGYSPRDKKTHDKGSSGGVSKLKPNPARDEWLSSSLTLMEELWQTFDLHLNFWLLIATGDEQTELGKLSVVGSRKLQPILNIKLN